MMKKQIGLLAAYALPLLLLFPPAGSQAQTCVKHGSNEGCVPPLQPQQCFPVASGPSFWQDVGTNFTWQYRRAIQSPVDTCTPVPLGETIPNCCGGIPPSGGPPPTLSIRIVGSRIMVDYDAPNLYCTNTGEWPPNYTCFNDPMIAPDRLTLSDAGGPFRWAFIYFERGTWDTGVDIPCGTTGSYSAGIGYAVSGGTRTTATTALTPFTSICADRHECGAPSGSVGPVSAGLPINVGSGDVTVKQDLFTIAQDPMPLPFTLTYHSSPPVYPTLMTEPVGKGWSHEYSQSLRPEDGSSNRLYHITSEGYEHEYLRTAPDNFWMAINPGDLRGTIQQVGSEYRLTDLNGAVTSFDIATGRWNSTKDRWGNTIAGTYTSGQLTTITDSMGREVQLAYPAGQVTITLPNGKVWKLTLSAGLLTAIRDPLHPSLDWRTYSYVSDHAGVQRLLSSIKDDAGKELEAHTYDNVAGTGTDRGLTSSQALGTRSNVSVTYGGGNTRTVTHTIDGSTQQTTTFTLAYLAGRWLPTQISGNCATCGGTDSDLQVFTYDYSNHVIDRKDGSGGDEVDTRYTYDGNGMLLSQTEAQGKPEQRTTTYAYAYVPPGGSGLAAWPSFLTRVTEESVANPGVSRTKTYTWNSSGVAETALTTQTTGFLNSTMSETHTTVSSFDTPRHRLTGVTGPAPNQRVTRSYFPDAATNNGGRLQTVSLYTSSTAHLDSGFATYDLYGTSGTVTDPNSVQTITTQDDRGRTLTVVSKKPATDSGEPVDYTTSYVYDSRDRLTSVTLPGINKIAYEYEDGTNRLVNTIRVDLLNKQQERLHLTLNAIGGKAKEEAQVCSTPANPCSPANWVTRRSDDFTYDIHNRISAVVHPIGGRIDYTYDTRGNLTGVKDERHTGDALPNLVYAYDGLNRLISVTQKRTISPGTAVTTGYMYDKLDNLKQVTDPKGNVTNYEYDDFGQMRKQTSPVSGVTTYTYDFAGNLMSSTDANGAATTRAYDASNRILTATSTRSGLSAELVTYTYDAGEPADEPNPPNPAKAHPKRYGKGRLASMSDPSGSSQFAYERRGLLKKEWKTIDLDTYAIGYGYDANGNRTSIRYPSGRLVSYGFDFADRPLSASSPGTTYVTSAVYQPFGPESQIDYGNGTSKTMTFDLRYRPLTNKLVKTPTMISQQTFVPDGVGNITSITDNLDSTYSRTTLSYDDLNRLTTANSGTSLWGTGSYTYDDLGSVNPSLTMGTRTASFVYSGTTPKLTSVNESGVGNRTVTYDAAGNETMVGSSTFSYSARNFLSSADNLTYTYDGRGLRVTTALSSTVFPISLTISPVSVVKGATATGTVTLNVGAPVGGASVTLKSSDTAVAAVPASATVAQGQTAQTFSITTSASITADAKVVISATYGNVTKSEALSVTTTPRLSLISVSPRSVQGGSSATGTVTLSAPASGTATVTLTSSNTAAATVPTSVPVSSGQTSATFNITTFGVSASQAVTITASYLGVSRWASLTVMQVLAQGSEIEKSWFGERVPAFRLARLSLSSGTSGFLAGSIRKGDLDSLGDEEFSLGLARADHGAGVRPMDGPIYSVPGPSKRNYLYSPEMNLLAESEVSSPRDRQILYEYIWFNGHPVAQVDGGTVTHWTFTDQLGTATIQTDTAGAVFWRAEYEPYGRVWTLRPPTLADQHQPLRLPGQEAEQFNLGTNGLTERFYNIFRWYRPNWGRYTQPDPIKPTLPEMPLFAYAYAGDSPLRFTDPDGLYRIDPNFPSECRPALDQAIGIVQNAFNRIPGCSDCPPSAIGRTYKSLLDDPNLVIGYVARSRVSPCAYGETPWYVDPRTGQFTAAPNPRVTGFACRMGRWLLARAIVHELTHVGGASFEAAAYAREVRCGFPPLNPASYGCPP